MDVGISCRDPCRIIGGGEGSKLSIVMGASEKRREERRGSARCRGSPSGSELQALVFQTHRQVAESRGTIQLCAARRHKPLIRH